MVSKDSSTKGSFWQEDPFDIIKPKDFSTLGINPADIPPGSFAARKHPILLSSRFGGNAYGFGFFEIYNHLDEEDTALLQSISFDDRNQVKEHHEAINKIYKKIGLLIRFSNRGIPYYLIPSNLLSTTITNKKSKADEISKIIEFHRKKYLKEGHKIGVLTHEADPIINDLTLRFKEHQFFIIDSPEKFRSIKEPLDLIILTRDIYRTIILEKLSHPPRETLSKKQLERHAIYMLGKIYNALKPDGEIFIIANYQQVKTNRTTIIRFNTVQEKKRFLIFTHIFKTRKRYCVDAPSLEVNIYDLERYLGPLYVDNEVIDRLSGGKDLEEMTLEGISKLSYLDLPLDNEYDNDQRNIWARLISIYFNQIFLKPMIPNPVKAQWKKRLSFLDDYSPNYMLICLAQKKPFSSDVSRLKKDMMESKLTGCPLPLLADYRDSFDYLIRTLNVLNDIKNKNYVGLPQMFLERLTEPFDNKKMRYAGLNHILKLMSNTEKLERIRSYLNPDMIESPKTRVLENLEILSFFGFSYEELKEIFLIIIGHTTGGRILSGKMSEKTLKPMTDLARTYGNQEALNLLRYCRLMSMAETVASRRAGMDQARLVELFDVFDSALRVVTDRNMDWDTLLDEKISAMGGIHNKLIHKLLIMMNHFELLENWAEFIDKGEMERETLADYDRNKLARIDNVISLVKIIEQFENKFLRDDPLQLPIIYRKFLNMEFHGTEHTFAQMDSQLVFTLLWVAVNVTQGNIINFNPILSDLNPSETENRLKKVQEEAGCINREYLDLNTLKELCEQLYENHSVFILNTGFRLSLNQVTRSVDISFIDMDEDIVRLDAMAQAFSGNKISDIPPEELQEMERLFANLEDFYRGHQLLITRGGPELKIPEKQRRWFRKARDLREYIRSNLIKGVFEPEEIFTDLDMLFRYSLSVLHLILPELSALQDLNLSKSPYLKTPVMDHILNSTKKMQALILGNLKEFQDHQTLHKLAQREFGPTAAGIVGLNEVQIEILESIVSRIRPNRPLFDAMIKLFIFHDLGLTPALREKYKTEINIADQARNSASFLIKEKIPHRYGMEEDEKKALVTLIRNHDRLLHLVKGEFTLQSLKEIIDYGDKDIFDAFFVSSLLMFSAMDEGLVLEDLADRLFEMRRLCLMVIEGKTLLEDYLEDNYLQKGRFGKALDNFYRSGLPRDTSPSHYIESWKGHKYDKGEYCRAGEMIQSTERIFRLRGLRHIEYIDVAKFIVKVPLRYIYQKRDYRSVGYATFEKELFEALRIYNSIHRLPEKIRTFILEQLAGDKVRIFGFEDVSSYLNYENIIKLLLISLLGSKRFKKDGNPVHLSFLNIIDKIDKRYEALNDALGKLPMDTIWRDRTRLTRLFKVKTGLLLRKDVGQKVLIIDFVDRSDVSRKISQMEKITDLEQLKTYYHRSLQSLRNNPFYTDDYELQLERAFNKRLIEISDMILAKAKRQMEQLNDFKEIHNIYVDFLNHSLEIGFSKDQKDRLNDIYELRRDNLRREKLQEINSRLERIYDNNEVKDYWDEIKYYLLTNKPFIGKEVESLIAKSFDTTIKKIKGM
jgi:hypothetical protein